MSSKQFQVGDVVRHRRRGVGKVSSVDAELIEVEYDGGRSNWSMNWETAASLLIKLPEDSPEARLLHFPETLNDWASEAPLRLVGAALSLQPERQGKSGDIKSRLAGIELPKSWSAWWGQVLPAVQASTDYFQMGKQGSVPIYSFSGNIADIPEIPLSEYPAKSKAKPARKPAKPKPVIGTSKEWSGWFLSEQDSPPPGAAPNSQFVKSLSSKPKNFPEHGLQRAVAGANAALSGERKVHRPADWLNLMLTAARRWNGEFGKDGLLPPPIDTGKTAFRLWQAIPAKANLPPLQDIASLLYAAGSVRGGLASDWWQLYFEKEEGVSRFLIRLASVTENPAKVEFWQEMAEAALSPSYPQRNSMLGELLAMLNADEQQKIRRRLLFETADRGTLSPDALLEFLNDQTDLLLAGLLFMDAPPERALQQGAARLHGAIAYGNTPGEPIGPTVARLTQTTRQRVEETIESNANALRQRLEAEVARITNQFAAYRQDVVQKREKSHSEIRRDLLELISDTLRLVNSSDRDISARLRDAQAILTLALRAGGGDLREAREAAADAVSTAKVSVLQEAN